MICPCLKMCETCVVIVFPESAVLDLKWVGVYIVQQCSQPVHHPIARELFCYCLEQMHSAAFIGTCVVIQPFCCAAFAFIASCLLLTCLVVRCCSFVQGAETLRCAHVQCFVDHRAHGVVDGQSFTARADERPATQLGVQGLGVVTIQQRAQRIDIEVAQYGRCLKRRPHLLRYAFQETICQPSPPLCPYPLNLFRPLLYPYL